MLSETERIRAALLELSKGIGKALSALEEIPTLTSTQKWLAVYDAIPPEGLNLEQMRVLLGQFGIDPRSLGGQIRYGRLRRGPGAAGTRDVRYWQGGRRA